MSRAVAIMGDMAVQTLHNRHKPSPAPPCTYVFSAIAEADKLELGVLLSDKAVYYVVKQMQQNSASPFRRMMRGAATAPRHSLQAEAGHKQGSTTLRYAKPVEARHHRQVLLAPSMWLSMQRT